MSSSENIVIPGPRAVHDGLGNKLAGTVLDQNGQIVSQPVHTVPGAIAEILTDMGVANAAPEGAAPAAEEPAPEPEPAPTPDPVEAVVAETEAEAAPDPAPEPVAEPDTVESGIEDAEAEAAPEGE